MEIVEKDNNCKDCEYFDYINNKCFIDVISPIRKCVIAINKDLVKELRRREERVKFLEIGCGNWSYVKNENIDNLIWEGVDIEEVNYRNKKTIATKMGSVEKIPFEAEEFDYVLANQSIEHWFEYGVTIKRGLSQISRVLKIGGKAMINVPIHFHGNKFFLNGNLKKIFSFFDERHWSILEIEKWRINPFPLEKYRGWERGAFSDCLGKEYEGKTTYILNIVATKKSEYKINAFDNFKYYSYKFISLITLNKKMLTFLNYGFSYSLKILKNRGKYKKYEEKMNNF